MPPPPRRFRAERSRTAEGLNIIGYLNENSIHSRSSVSISQINVVLRHPNRHRHRPCREAEDRSIKYLTDRLIHSSGRINVVHLLDRHRPRPRAGVRSIEYLKDSLIHSSSSSQSNVVHRLDRILADPHPILKAETTTTSPGAAVAVDLYDLQHQGEVTIHLYDLQHLQRQGGVAINLYLYDLQLQGGVTICSSSSQFNVVHRLGRIRAVRHPILKAETTTTSPGAAVAVDLYDLQHQGGVTIDLYDLQRQGGVTIYLYVMQHPGGRHPRRRGVKGVIRRWGLGMEGARGRKPIGIRDRTGGTSRRSHGGVRHRGLAGPHVLLRVIRPSSEGAQAERHRFGETTHLWTDRPLGGCHPGEVVIDRPHMGHSLKAFMIDIRRHVSKDLSRHRDTKTNNDYINEAASSNTIMAMTLMIRKVRPTRPSNQSNPLRQLTNLPRSISTPRPPSPRSALTLHQGRPKLDR